MGGVSDGQAVDQAITNAAFLYKNANDTSSGVYTLNAPTSGPQVDDIQNTINVIINGVGGSQYAAATAYSSIPSNTIAQGDTLNVAASKLARKFYGAASAGGHSHSGADGDGALVSAVQSLAASGFGPAATGAVVLKSAGFAYLNQVGTVITIGANAPALADVLAVNNAATAGINFNGGAISGLSYIDWSEAGFPGYPATGHVYLAASAGDHLYLRTSASATHRVDTSIAASGSSSLYGDVVIAASGAVVLGQSGQNITIYAPVAAASGSAVNSIAASGTSGLTGAVVLVPGTNVTLTQSGQNITIAASGGSASPLTTKGDIYGYDTAGNRIPIGTNNQILTADSTQSLGLKWATPATYYYRRPNLVFSSTTQVNAQNNTGTANQTSILFPDGALYSVTEGTPTYYRAFKTGQNANWTSTTQPQGGLRTGSAAANTWYAIYAVKCTGVGFTSNFVLVGDTVLPTQGNFATLNSNFGTNGWAYLGLVRYGDNGGTTTSILSFVQSGSRTSFFNVLSSSYTFAFNAPGTLLSAQNGSTNYSQYTYSAGTGTTNIPNNISLAIVTVGSSAGGSGIMELTVPTTNGGSGGPLYLVGQQSSFPNFVASSPLLPVTNGFLWQSSGGSAAQTYISLSGFIDDVLTQGESPQL